MGIVVFILVLVLVILAFVIFGEDLLDILINFFLISLGMMFVGGVLCLLYKILT